MRISLGSFSTITRNIFNFAPYSLPCVDLGLVSPCDLFCVICFTLALFAVGSGARILPESETRRSSHLSLVPIDPHVVLHYYRWLSCTHRIICIRRHHLRAIVTPSPFFFPLAHNSLPRYRRNHPKYALRHRTRKCLFGSIRRSERSLGPFSTTTPIFRV